MMKNKRIDSFTQMLFLLLVIYMSSTVNTTFSPRQLDLTNAVANDEKTAVPSNRDGYSGAVTLDTALTSGKEGSDILPRPEDSNELLPSNSKGVSKSFKSSGNLVSFVQSNPGSIFSSETSTLVINSEGTVNDSPSLSDVRDN